MGDEMTARPVETGSSQPIRRRAVRRRLDAWLLSRRRARQAKKRAPGRRATIALLFLVLLLLGSFFASLNYLSPDPSGKEVTLGELRALATLKRIDTATFLDEDNRLVGTFVAKAPEDLLRPKEDEEEGSKRSEAAGRSSADGEDRREGKRNKEDDKEPKIPPSIQRALAEAPDGSGSFWLSYPKTGAAFGLLSNLVTRAGADVSIDSQSFKTFVRAVTTYLLPLLILASVFGLLFATGGRSGSGIGDVVTFGTLNKKRYKKGFAGPTTFDDVGSADEAIEELEEVVDYLRDPRRYEEIGAMPPKGVLLFGPPGCGKTLLAKAVAGEAGVPFFSVAGAEFVESLVGVGAARVRDLFQRVRAVAPAIVFIDELDAAGRRRAHGGGEGGSDEREQTLNQLLVEMDGFEVSAGIVVIAATNRPDILDPALLRPGRFDRHITVEQPDLPGRREILELHARGKPVAADVDYDYIAKRTPGFSGADLASVMNEAALLSLRANKPEIETEELEEAIQRVLHGPKKRGRVLSPEEERRAATHEAGHAVVAAALGEGERVHRVSILARGRGIGLAGIHNESETLLMTTAQVYSRLVVEMSGLAAEALFLGDVSTGAEQDLEKATEIARDMVGRFGMSPVLGRVRLMASDVDQFLGAGTGFASLSSDTQRDVDVEVKRLLDRAEADARNILVANSDAHRALAQSLEEHETLEGLALSALLEHVTIEPLSSAAAFPGSGNRSGNGAGAKVSRSRTAPKGRGRSE